MIPKIFEKFYKTEKIYFFCGKENLTDIKISWKQPYFFTEVITLRHKGKIKPIKGLSLFSVILVFKVKKLKLWLRSPQLNLGTMEPSQMTEQMGCVQGRVPH